MMPCVHFLFDRRSRIYSKSLFAFHADCPVMLVFACVYTRVLARYAWGRFMYDKVKVKFTL